MWYGNGYGFRPKPTVAARRAQAAREVEKQRKKGEAVAPVVIEGRKIARTFWGKAWCDNLESYSDYANRLPRGRSYVCNGSVVDLQIEPGKVTALVSGSQLYKVSITIAPLTEKRWRLLKGRCAGQIGSVVELLQGHLSESVIGLVTSKEDGLFPGPREIALSCSCPDWADMCKHVAAAMYGVGARLDHQPELFFRLRKVDHLELIEEAVAGAGKKTATRKKTLAEADVASVFGIEFAESAAAPAAAAPPKKRQARAQAAKLAAAGRSAKAGKRRNGKSPA